KIFFFIFEQGKDKLVPLKEVADVRFGIKTGANEFFYLKEVADVRRGFTTGANEFFYLTQAEINRWKIEKEFLQPIIFTLKEVNGYVLNKDKLKYRVVICNKEKKRLKGKNILKYIRWGEENNFHKRPTCNSRKPWYSLGKGWHYAPLIFPAKVGERMPVILNDSVFEDKKLYGITPRQKENIQLTGAILNSTYTRMMIEFTCRQLTGSQAIADIDVAVVEDLYIPDFKKISEKEIERLETTYKKLCKTDCLSIFKELGARKPSEVSLSKVKPDRRELDKIIMGEILGLTDEEQLEVYHAVVDLVSSRIEKAKSVEKNNNFVEGIDIIFAGKDAVSELKKQKI
ncbi:MAG: hypothetical protein HY738_22475, partial [Bacteroidia bacterium]|nr:hypothetical protein [Bacteroidia bacterium]